MTIGNRTINQGRREATSPEKKRDKMRGDGVTRGGEVEVLQDGRRWEDNKPR